VIPVAAAVLEPEQTAAHTTIAFVDGETPIEDAIVKGAGK
jgi:hypothetical protein